MIHLKKIISLSIAIMISNLGAMIVPHCEILRSEIVQSFPLYTFEQARNRSLNQVALRRPYFKRDCYKTTLTFDIATKLPYEVQQVIVLKLFDYNEKRANTFLQQPIAQALESYAYAKEVMEDKAALLLKKEIKDAVSYKSYYKTQPYIDNIFVDHGTIFDLAKEIKIVDNLLTRNQNFFKRPWNGNHSNIASREELHALAKIIEKNSFLAEAWADPHYEAYQKLTLPLFKKHFMDVVGETKKACIIAMIPLLLGSLSRIIELQLGNKMNYSTDDCFKIYAPYCGLLPWVMAFNGDTISIAPHDEQKLLTLGVFGGLMSMLIMAFILPREYLLWVYGGIVGLYVTTCAIVGIINARIINKYRVPFNKISETLSRDDIVIVLINRQM
jgi:hypothetical protein